MIVHVLLTVEGEVEPSRSWKAGIDFEINLEFRTTNDTGLLLYVQSEDLSDYIQLQLVNGKVWNNCYIYKASRF